MTKYPKMSLVVSVIVALTALGFLSMSTLVPYPLVRNGVYTSAAFLVLLSISLVASYWLDIQNYGLRTNRQPTDLRNRVTFALFLFALACLLLISWEFQENRELCEAREAYKNRDFVRSKELFLQQQRRFWTTDPRYSKISSAVRASELGRQYDKLVQRYVLYIPTDKEYELLKGEMDQLKTDRQRLYEKWEKDLCYHE